MKLLAVVILLELGSEVFGLRCWNCRNAASNRECNSAGRIQTCGPKQGCVNQETTSADGSTHRITKGCRKKTIRACRRRDPQNVGIYPTNCENNDSGSTCECCCDTDMCNSPQMECKDVVTCRKPDNPGNGRIKCPKSISFGTRCTVTCKPGYARNGPSTVTCVNGTDQGYFSPRETVACLARTSRPRSPRPRAKVPGRCRQQLTAPKHGSIVCENREEHRDKRTYNYIGSICAFKCETGYFLGGQETTRCLSGGSWSNSRPTCRKGACQQPGKDVNRINDCSDGFHVGSICNMRCKDGFRLVGATTSICNSINDRIPRGRWSNMFPGCVKELCRPQLTAPANGIMTCSKRNQLGSYCTFLCDDGYALTDASLANDGIVQCIDVGDKVEWDGIAPTCSRITCPRLQIPDNGNVACVGDGRLGSKCTFRCNVGFDLVGAAEKTLTTECIDDRDGDGTGAWSVDSVNCVPIRCQPKRMAPTNGAVYCTDGNKLGSVCTFSCNEDHDMDDTPTKVVINVCEADDAGDGMGKWSARPASCSMRYYCATSQSNPEHGSVDCDNEAYLGSVCQFSCDVGYELKGIDRITCRDLSNDGDAEVEWTNPAPTCVASTCPEQWFDATTTSVTCNREKEDSAYPVGTRCTYECIDAGYYIETNKNSDNGVVTCVAKNTWSRPASPRCYRKICPVLEKIENGNQPECTNGYRFGSQCRFTCSDKYSPSHGDPLTCQAVSRREKTASWDIPPPTCVLSECQAVPPNPRKGTAVCSSGAELGSFCTLQCDRGYAPKITRVDCILTRRTVDGVEVDFPMFRQLEDFCCARCLSEYNVVLAVNVGSAAGLQNVVNFVTILLSRLAGQENDVNFSAFSYNAVPDRLSVIRRSSLKSRLAAQDIIQLMEEWKIEQEVRASDTRAAISFAQNSLFTALDVNAVNFLIVAADDSPDNVSPALLSQLNESAIKIIVAPGNNFSKIKWDRLLPREDVVNQDANEVADRMQDVASERGCSKLAKECA